MNRISLDQPRGEKRKCAVDYSRRDSAAPPALQIVAGRGESRSGSQRNPIEALTFLDSFDKSTLASLYDSARVNFSSATFSFFSVVPPQAQPSQLPTLDSSLVEPFLIPSKKFYSVECSLLEYRRLLFANAFGPATCTCSYVERVSCPVQEGKWVIPMKNLRDFYDAQIYKLFSWTEPPKESFNRWLFERYMLMHSNVGSCIENSLTGVVLESPSPTVSSTFATPDSTPLISEPIFTAMLVSVLPLRVKSVLSTSLAREILEDLPTKIKPPAQFIGSTRQACEHLEVYVRESTRLLRNTNAGGAREQLEMVLQEMNEIASKWRKGFVDDKKSTTAKLNVCEVQRLRALAAPLWNQLMESAVNHLCESLSEQSDEAARVVLSKMVIYDLPALSLSPSLSSATADIRDEPSKFPASPWLTEVPAIRKRSKVVVISFRGDEHELTEEHFCKLVGLYHHHHSHLDDDRGLEPLRSSSPPRCCLLPGTSFDPFKDSRFLRLLYCLLRRYATMFGPANRGGSGHQGAVPQRVLRLMNELFDVNAECFASPFNSYFPLYCSAFPVLELPFGSIGSFFSTQFLTGSFEANPPFTEEFIVRMFEHMTMLLVRADASNTAERSCPLSFIVVIPHWLVPPLQAGVDARSSPFFRGEVILSAKKHSYVVGLQHRPNEAQWGESGGEYRSVHETQVIFLQNDAAYRLWAPTESRKDRLKKVWETYD